MRRVLRSTTPVKSRALEIRRAAGADCLGSLDRPRAVRRAGADNSNDVDAGDVDASDFRARDARAGSLGRNQQQSTSRRIRH
jgi:hypothetical protein